MGIPVDEEIIDRGLIRSVSNPGAKQSSVAARISILETTEDYKIIDGKVRRLWTPGDPWNDNFYFGSAKDDA